MKNIQVPTSTWLFDTGADVTVLAMREFRKILIDKRPVKKPPTMKISSASSDSLKIVGVYKFPFTVMNKTMKHNVIVVNNLNSNAIMGIDLIKKLGLVYKEQKKTFMFEEEEPQFKQATMEVISAEFILAFTQMPIRIATSTDGGNRPATNLNFMVTIMSNEFPQLSGGPGWVVPNHAGQVTMVVQNCSPVDLHIPRGTKMGVLENIHHEKIQPQPMDGKKIIEQLNARKPEKNLPKPLSPAEQKEFLSKLNLNVPEDKRKLYEQIILANHDVFSKTKDDLGKTNNFKHNFLQKQMNQCFKNNTPFLKCIVNIWRNKFKSG